MFVSGRENPNLKGNTAEFKIAAAATALGIPVLRPMAEHGRYDLLFEMAERFLRVQCKWAPRTADVISVRLCTSRRGPEGFIRSPYTADEVDAVCAYCPDTDDCYLLPIDVVEGITGIQLRLAPAKNGQRAALHFAADYSLGAVAQLEVAPAWHAGGRGFESRQLHSPAGGVPVATVGANEFRHQFGWYMQRAAAGESFNVTRRGKPYVRLVPGVDQLPVATPIDPHEPTVGAESREPRGRARLRRPELA